MLNLSAHIHGGGIVILVLRIPNGFRITLAVSIFLLIYYASYVMLTEAVLNVFCVPI